MANTGSADTGRTLTRRLVTPYLMPGEQPLFKAHGLVTAAGSDRPSRHGWVVVTDRRVFPLDAATGQVIGHPWLLAMVAEVQLRDGGVVISGLSAAGLPQRFTITIQPPGPSAFVRDLKSVIAQQVDNALG